jgi:Ser/Thr protein kinase RdoA (MazF antagonist)
LFPPRTAELVLVTPDGAVVGCLPPVPVSTPWWQDIAPVVRAVRERDGIDVTVLRLLAAERDRPHGGRVTYLAEVAQRVPAAPWHGTLDEQALRQAFAKPGGPGADLAWARSMLIDRGLRPMASPVQVRTWNLSSLWRIPVEGGTAWLKVVPPFLAHEGDLLARLAGERVPILLGHEGGRMLLAEIAGADCYDAELPLLLEMVTLLVELQRSWSGRVDELLALGLPDWRAAALVPKIADVVKRTAHELSAADRAALGSFARGLPARFAAVAASGIGDTLVHGDFHPGNFRGDGRALTLLDWGDSGVGHPLLDQTAFLDRVPEESVPLVREHWLRLWRESAPDADPARAASLLAPIAAARQAVIYRGFLDRIEPAEHPYHRCDPAEWLRRTAALAGRHPTSA